MARKKKPYRIRTSSAFIRKQLESSFARLTLEFERFKETQLPHLDRVERAVDLILDPRSDPQVPGVLVQEIWKRSWRSRLDPEPFNKRVFENASNAATSAWTKAWNGAANPSAFEKRLEGITRETLEVANRIIRRRHASTVKEQEQAFLDLWDWFEDMAVRSARGACPGEVEDIVQEVKMRLWARSRLEPEKAATFRGYTRTIAVRVAWKECRGGEDPLPDPQTGPGVEYDYDPVASALKMIFSCLIPPHQAVAFAYNTLLGYEARHIASLFRGVPLRTLFSDFLVKFDSAAVSKEEIHRLCRPMHTKMGLRFDETVTGPTFDTYEHLEGLLCGDTTLDHYNTGLLPAKLTAWNRRTATRVRRAMSTQPAVLGAQLAEALQPGHPPYDNTVYGYIEILGESHTSVIVRSKVPLRALLDEIGARLAEKGLADATAQSSLRDYMGVLTQPLREILSDPKYRADAKAYAALGQRIAGDLRLTDFESDQLASDINNWRDRVTRTLRRKLLDEQEGRGEKSEEVH